MTDQPEQSADLEPIWQRGRAAWPELDLSREAFAAYVGERLSPGQDARALAAEDLYLAAACVVGVPQAAATFIARHRPATERQAHKLVREQTAREELLQALWAHLLTPGPDGGPPKLAQYRGRGPLEAWLRVTVTRRGLDEVRRLGGTPVDFEAVAFQQAAESDPELSVLRRRHRDDIAAIFKEAAEATPREDRTLLRMHYVDGATMNELAAVFRTSRSGIHRRLEAARAALMERITALVRERLSLAESQHASMLGIFQSELRSHLGHLLRTD